MGASLRRFVWKRAKETCEYCGVSQQFDDLRFEIDHIVAIKHHGATDAGNLALSCYYCNAYKGPNIAGLDPDAQKVSPLFHPRRDKWSEHFQWNHAKLAGLTAVGRTTVDILRINLPERVALRIALIEEGVFPG